MQKIHMFLLTSLTVFSSVTSSHTLEPLFVKSLSNITVTEGREATFTCIVHHLGGHKVAWIKADSKAILAIHNMVMTHFNRLSIIHNDHNTWTLILRNVRRSDSGPYMCQVNTDPMRYQVGHLNVVVPPDIVTSETSSDIIIPEGDSARLHCKANGHPPPSISWKREDRQDIVLRQDGKHKVTTFTGEVLQLERVTRSEMGMYLCIANNGVPPPVSKRTMVTVNFPPMLEVADGLIGAPHGATVTLACRVQASPRSIHYWSRHNGDMILSGPRRRTAQARTSLYRYVMNLTLHHVTQHDFGTYRCIAKNSIGEAEGAITVHQIHLPSSAGPWEESTEPTGLLTEVADFEQSGEPPFSDDEDFAYGGADEPALRRPTAPDRPRVVLNEQSKSACPGLIAAHLLPVLTILGRHALD